MTEYRELAEAARRLGLSSEALKKRLIRGTVPGRKENGRWIVLVSDTQGDVRGDVTTRDDNHHDNGVTPSPHPSEAPELARIVLEQQKTIIELSGRIGWLQAENQRLLLLTAPAVVDVDSAPLPNGQDSPLQPVSEHPRRWWRRLVFG